MKKFLVALSFFTRIPIKIKSEVTEDEFYASMSLLPVVGLVIGAVLYGVSYLLGDINKEVSALLLIFLYIWLTGGLHMDGFIDTIDGVLSNRERERIFEIMKDSRIGAFGAIGILMLILGYFIMMKFTGGFVLLLMPIVGRSCALMASSLSEYAKKTNDLGKRFVESMGKKEMIFALLFTAGIITIVNYIYLLSFGICILISLYFVHLFKAKLSGMTGDTIGMMIELNQLIFLFSSYLITFFLGGI